MSSLDSPAVIELRQELELTQAKLAESYKMMTLGRLVAGIVHEINTPIGSILSNTEVLSRSMETLQKLLEAAQTSGMAPAPKALTILETMRSLASVDKLACERISSVIRGLKTYARVDDIEVRKADLHEILVNAIKIGGCEFRRRVAVETEFGALPEVECYPHLLSQVFLNLLVNASQAIEGEGKITVRTAVDGRFALVSITDTGRGIRPEDRPKIFARGFSTKAIGIGTGLGLAITREIIVDKHGGEIWFESEPGTGTTFHVRIPLEQPKKEGVA